MDRLRQPLAEALRAIRHDSLHAAGATLTLALGASALSAPAAVAHGVGLRPPPHHQPDRLVAVLQALHDA